MKKRIVKLLLLATVLVLCSGVQSDAKAKKVKLNKSKVVLQKGKSVQLKLKNTTKGVKWSSSNKYTASVNKNGKVRGKRLGTVTITARSAGRKYQCQVRVCSDINADKITMKYENDVFTEGLYKKVIRIEKNGTVVVNDKKALKAIYSKFASLKLSKYESTEPLLGGMRFEFIMEDGKKAAFVLGGRYLEINGIVYQSDKNIMEDIAALLEENRCWDED